MNILIDICHPAHVHLFKNFYMELKNNHHIIVTTKNIKSVIDLLTSYDIDYICIGGKSDSLVGKSVYQLKYNWEICRLAKKHKIDIALGTSLTISQVSRFRKMKSIIFDDDDDHVQPLMVMFGHSFANCIISPDALLKKRKNKRTFYYPGYHELAYLHPKNFTSSINVIHKIGLRPGEPYFVLRFNSFKAHHDSNVEGFNLKNKIDMIDLLKGFGRIFITTEGEIEKEFVQYQLKIVPDEMHSLISHAAMLIGDSQTMTSEAAVLGTPAIRLNTLVGELGVLEELEHKYSLTFGFKPCNSEEMLKKIKELLSVKNKKKVWEERRIKMLKDKIDVTSFFIWFVENYPSSVQILKRNPDFPNQFK